MDGKSLDLKQDKIEKLKKVMPEAFTEGLIDWEKLKAALGEDIEFKNERYVLNWAGKSDAFRVLQAPTTATLAHDRNESANFDDTGNVFIEGENLEVLKVLQKSYFGKIKMIYIDPPYNTGNDNFIYPDRFSETKEEYLGRIGDKDEAGYMTRKGLFRKNSKDSGHYHSNWLSMMYPRLFLARNLLKDDGVIFVSIDDNEVHNLRLLMNEVFGEENFIDCIIWKKRYGGGAKEKFLVSLHEYVLVYAKNLAELPEIFIPLSQKSIDRYYKLKDKNFGLRGAYRTHPLEATKSMGREKILFIQFLHQMGLKLCLKGNGYGVKRGLKKHYMMENLNLLRVKMENGQFIPNNI
jgi:adenine-specific DNA-methyltransferase